LLNIDLEADLKKKKNEPRYKLQTRGTVQPKSSNAKIPSITPSIRNVVTANSELVSAESHQTVVASWE
jgi:hypothetical protein